MLKFVHAADLHLDSPLRGLARYDGAPVDELRGATRRALQNLVQLCLDETADLLLIAGDVYDGDWKDYNTGLFFHQQMTRLSRRGVRVVLVRGNHDAASQISRSLRLPDGVVELDTTKAQTVVYDDLKLAVHGRGYPRQEVTDNLAADYPEPLAGYYNIGLLHTALDGREGHAPYAPCRVVELIAKGYDYWALGHVHQHEIIRRDPWIVFPGNLQGRHVRETGAKGATLVSVDSGGAGTRLEQRSLDVLRWALCELPVDQAEDPERLLELAGELLSRELAAASGRPLAARLRLTGECRFQQTLVNNRERWIGELRALAHELGDELWLEQIKWQTRAPLDLAALAGDGTPLAGLLTALAQDRSQNPSEVLRDPDELEQLRRLAQSVRLPPEYRLTAEPLELDRPEVLAGLLAEAEQLLLPRLLAHARDDAENEAD